MTPPSVTLYGIANCDTVKKSRAWLAEHGVAVRFHDFKKAGVPPDRLPRWMDALGWEKLLNRQGTTWRQLDAATQAAVVDAPSAGALLQGHASAIRRPVIEWSAGEPAVTVGFAPADWLQRLTR